MKVSAHMLAAILIIKIYQKRTLAILHVLCWMHVTPALTNKLNLSSQDLKDSAIFIGGTSKLNYDL